LPGYSLRGDIHVERVALEQACGDLGIVVSPRQCRGRAGGAMEPAPAEARFKSPRAATPALAFHVGGHYLAGVSRRINPTKPANLRSWRVIIMRSRGEYLGSVEAPDCARAEAIAVKSLTWTRTSSGGS
jgi:hypothetical protein